MRSSLALGLGVSAAYGTHLLVTARALGWSGIGPGPRRSGSTVVRIGRRRARAWRSRAGLDGVRAIDLAAASGLLAVLGAALAYVVFGAAVPALAVAVAAAATPVVGASGRRRARRAAAQEAWPRMIEEIRIQTASLGRSVPVALIEVGRRGPSELRPDFDAAAREWLTSTDFARTVAVLKDRLADPTADATCETLLVAHEVGGTDLEARLRRLAEDRIADVQARRDARAEQAGARYARAFVLIVPLGMAAAGASLGEGREAYRSGMGQVAVLVALAMVAACWAWSGAIMRLPQPERVFDR